MSCRSDHWQLTVSVGNSKGVPISGSFGPFSQCPFLLSVTIDLLFPSASSTVTCGSHGELVSLRGITFSCSGFRLSATCSFTVIACSDPSDIFRARARFVSLSATKYCDPLRVSYSLFPRHVRWQCCQEFCWLFNQLRRPLGIGNRTARWGPISASAEPEWISSQAWG